MKEPIDRRAFLVSAGLATAVGAAKEEHELEGGEVLRLRKGDIVIPRCTEGLHPRQRLER